MISEKSPLCIVTVPLPPSKAVIIARSRSASESLYAGSVPVSSFLLALRASRPRYRLPLFVLCSCSLSSIDQDYELQHEYEALWAGRSHYFVYIIYSALSPRIC